MKEEKETLFGLLGGIILITALFGVVSLPFTDDNRILFGIIFGGAVSLLLCIHMYISLGKSLGMEPEAADSYIKKMAMGRKFFTIGAVIAAIFLSSWIHILGVIIGLLTLKLSAYAQIFFNKWKEQHKKTDQVEEKG